MRGHAAEILATVRATELFLRRVLLNSLPPPPEKVRSLHSIPVRLILAQRNPGLPANATFVFTPGRARLERRGGGQRGGVAVPGARADRGTRPAIAATPFLKLDAIGVDGSAVR